MSFHVAVAARTTGVGAITTLFNKGTNPSDATLVVYSNATSQPATPETAVPGGSLILSTIVFSDVAFGSPTSATGVANGLPILGNVIRDGTAGWFRFWDGAASPNSLGDGTCSVTGGGGDMTFDNIVLASGGVIRVNNISLGIPM